MTVKIFSAILQGCHIVPVKITVTSQAGQGLIISGLITETIHRDMSRIQFALHNCGMGIKEKKLRIDLEPAIFDNADTLMFPIAVGILIAAAKIIYYDFLSNYLIIGGLGVTGNIYEVDNAATMGKMANEKGFRGIIVPSANVKVIKFDYSFPVYPVHHLTNLANLFKKISLHEKIHLPKDLLEHLYFN